MPLVRRKYLGAILPAPFTPNKNYKMLDIVVAEPAVLIRQQQGRKYCARAISF